MHPIRAINIPTLMCVVCDIRTATGVWELYRDAAVGVRLALCDTCAGREDVATIIGVDVDVPGSVHLNS